MFGKRSALEREAAAARSRAELAEANARTAQANIAQEEANARAAAIRDRAETEAAERALRRAVRLAPLEQAAADAERVRMEAERSQEEANRSHAQANAAREAKERRRRANEATNRYFVNGAFIGDNLVAIGGQVAAYLGMGWPLWAALGAAAVVEALALALQHMAAAAREDGDQALAKQIGSYLVAGYVAVLNYSHWSDGWSPTGEAALFAFCSLASPFLRQAYATERLRAQHRAEGKPVTKPRRHVAFQFGILRWILWRKDTFAVLRWAVRRGERDANAAMIGYALDATTEQAGAVLATVRQEMSTAQLSLLQARRSLVEVAVRLQSERSPEGANGDANGANGDANGGERDHDDDGPEPLPNLPTPEEIVDMSAAERLSRARLTVVLARQAGIDLSGRGAELGRAFGYSAKWGQIRVKEEIPMFAISGTVERDDDMDDDDAEPEHDGAERSGRHRAAGGE